MQTLSLINYIIATLFAAVYAYQFLYIPLSWIIKEKEPDSAPLHDFAVLICARNEALVISDLIKSLKNQTYPQGRVHIFVMADNCDDDTAAIARACGANVYTRFDKTRVGKGYALDALMSHLREDYPGGFDAYIVFDADNLLEPDYIEQMNRTFSAGHDIITSYRNSKNYGDNWLSAGQGLWFLRESRYLNHARYLLGTSCAVSGTGFLFSRRIAEKMGGWPFHMLIEDIEFTIHQVCEGEKIAYCSKAVLYDEQPASFHQSWRQRVRWCRGYPEVFNAYRKALLKGVLKGSFSCFDMSMTIMPAFALAIISIVANLSLAALGALAGDGIAIALKSAGLFMISMYLMLFGMGAITTISEWKNIRTTAFKKVLYTITFPIFMLTYIPIAFSSLFCKPEWKP
ncbi:MAG: glycosyltransferase family 2 protein, partial [Clostridiales bacterium]|nr:glycosyltransferase family 2 protein [Clostridiales bacterium]